MHILGNGKPVLHASIDIIAARLLVQSVGLQTVGHCYGTAAVGHSLLFLVLCGLPELLPCNVYLLVPLVERAPFHRYLHFHKPPFVVALNLCFLYVEVGTPQRVLAAPPCRYRHTHIGHREPPRFVGVEGVVEYSTVVVGK